MGEKDFGLIESEYAFFVHHAIEAENDAAAYACELAGFEFGRASVRLLDFGCGDGAFTERLLRKLAWKPSAVRLALVEPVLRQLDMAAARLAPFSLHSIEAADRAPSLGASYDLVLSNHALYYVDDLEATLRRLTALLAPAGRMLLALAGWDNPLLEIWRIGFAELGQSVPYYTADDVAAALTRQGVTFRRMKVGYQLRFADAPQNRLKLLRFPLGEHLPQIDRQPLLEALDRHARGGCIDVRTQSDHFAVDAPAPGKKAAP